MSIKHNAKHKTLLRAFQLGSRVGVVIPDKIRGKADSRYRQAL